MRQQITIPLAKPLATHDGPLSRIVMREPTFDEYLAIGDPYIIAESPGGTRFIHENIENIRQYIGLCLVEPKDPALLTQANARVAKSVKEAVLGFFRPEAQEPADRSATSPTNSPSGDTGTSD